MESADDEEHSEAVVVEVAEVECYASVATRGDAAFRRIEQERISTDDVAAALTALLSGDLSLGWGPLDSVAGTPAVPRRESDREV